MDHEVEIAIAWVPADDYPTALERWPRFGEEWKATDHSEYSRFIEARLRDLRMVGATIAGVSQVQVSNHEAFCDEHALDPDSPESRSHHAAEIARLNGAIPWPPARNDPCWCGSGTKYKRCCWAAPPDHLSIHSREELIDD
jgi:hypothetical protein